MKPALLFGLSSPCASLSIPGFARGVGTAFSWLGGVGVAAWLVACVPSGWPTMWVIALTEFLILKFITLRGQARDARSARIVGYILGWPGMNAATFLGQSVAKRPSLTELLVALGKLGVGLACAFWAAVRVGDEPTLLTGWIGMLGIIFTLHFGVLHGLSWGWRRAGVVAPPIMRAPIAATTLSELWGERWNVAFAESARRLILRPLTRRWGARGAGALVFLLSGLLHETVISLPARGGWGGPTLYFLLQAAGIAAEKSAAGERLGLGGGMRGWAWTFLVAAGPLPLLFHAAFVRNVIVPFYRTLSAFLP